MALTTPLRSAAGLVILRARDALTVRQWFREAGGVRYWRGAAPDEWWLTALGSATCPSPWALPDPETITDIGRFAVAVPKQVSAHPVRIAREIPLGIYLTIHAQRKMRAEERRLRAAFAGHELWVEFDPPPSPLTAERTARWFIASMFLPLGGVEEGMEFLR